MSANPVARVNYFDEQFLRLADLVDEQAYHILMRRRHNLGGHTWGIVAGLVIEQDRDGNLLVQPGMAVDGYGRELILPYPHTLPPRAFAEKGSDELEVWLVYARQGAGLLPAGYTACFPTRIAQASRLQEMGRVELRASERDLFIDPTVDLPLRRQPPGVSAEDLEGLPLPNDDPDRPWPVYLGLVRRNEGEPVTYTINLGARPYAGLVGEAIRAPSGRAWVQLGAEREGDSRRFAVFVPGPDSDLDYPPRLAIHEGGQVTICGDTTLHGDLLIDGGVIEFRAGEARPVAQPWTLYHTRAFSNIAEAEADQLRVEMESGDEPSEVVVGVFSSTESAFLPCLTIDNQCRVTVHGNLVVQGRLEGTVSNLGTFNNEARSMVLGALNSGMNAGLQRAAESQSVEELLDTQPGFMREGFQATAATTGRLLEEITRFVRDNDLTTDLLARLQSLSEPAAAKVPAAEPAHISSPIAAPEVELIAEPTDTANEAFEGASSDAADMLPGEVSTPPEAEEPTENRPAPKSPRSRSRRKGTGKPPSEGEASDVDESAGPNRDM